MIEQTGAADTATAGLIAKAQAIDTIAAPRARYAFECIGPDGAVKWTETVHNIVTVTGKQLALDVVFGAVAKPSWFMLLKNAGAAAATDTLLTHAAWTEYANYTGTRPAVTFTAATVVSTTGAQVTHAAAISFAISGAGGTVAGVGVCTATSGTTGTLFNNGDFGAARNVTAGDSLNVTVTLSLAA